MTNWSFRTSEFGVDEELRLENVQVRVHAALSVLRGAAMLSESELDLGATDTTREEIEAALGCGVQDLVRLAHAARSPSAADIVIGPHTLRREAHGEGHCSYVLLGALRCRPGTACTCRRSRRLRAR